MDTPKLTANRILLIVLAIAAALAAVLIVVSLTGGDDDGGGAAGSEVHGATTVNAMLKGIPQSGNVLGNPDAPVTMVVYADFECPFCGRFSTETFPSIVDEYIRPGKVKAVYNGLAFLTPDSVEAAKAAAAAGLQDKHWNFSELVYHNQGEEGSGWVTDDLMRSLGGAIPGLDVDKMMDDRESAEVTAELSKAQQAAVAAGVNSTPTLQIGRTGQSLIVLQGADGDTLRQALDQLLAEQ